MSACHRHSSPSLAGEVVLQGEEEEEGLQQAKEKGAERGTELIHPVKLKCPLSMHKQVNLTL